MAQLATYYALPTPRLTPPQITQTNLQKWILKKHSWQDLKDFFRPIGDVGFTDVDQRNGEGVVEFMYKVGG